MGKPEFGVGLAAIFCEIGWLPKPGWELSVADGSTEDPRARWFRRGTAVFLAVITAAPMRMVASGGPLTVVASSSADHLMVSLHLASITEAVKKHGDPVGYRCSSGLGTTRGFPILLRRGCGQVRGTPVLSGGGTFSLLYRGGL